MFILKEKEKKTNKQNNQTNNKKCTHLQSHKHTKTKRKKQNKQNKDFCGCKYEMFVNFVIDERLADEKSDLKCS